MAFFVPRHNYLNDDICTIMIHISKIHELVELHNEFSLEWVAEDGRTISVDKAICTSFHSSGLSMNIKILSSGEIRTVNRYSLVKFNGEEVVL